MNKIIVAVASTILAVAFVSAVSFAAGSVSPICESIDKAEWMSKDAIIEKAAELGFDVGSVEATDGNCYSATSSDADGEEVELFFDPMTGEQLEANEPTEG